MHQYFSFKKKFIFIIPFFVSLIFFIKQSKLNYFVFGQSSYSRQWEVVAKISCPPNKVIGKENHLFYSLWPPNPLTWKYDTEDENKFTLADQHRMFISNNNNVSSLYFGIEINEKETKSLWPSGTTQEYIELKPKGTAPNSNITFGQYFNPYTWMVKFSPDLPSGTYEIEFEPKPGYEDKICVDLTSIPTISPNCGCENNQCSSQCSFSQYTDINYANPVKCSLYSSLFANQPSAEDKNKWCQRPIRTQGDVDGNGIVDTLDYMYYVSAFYGSKIPTYVNPDVDGDGEVANNDKNIIIRTIKSPPNVTPIATPNLTPGQETFRLPGNNHTLPVEPTRTY